MTRKTVFCLLLAAIGLLLLYWLSSYFAAYTDDAYLITDILRVTPRVDGHVQSVHVVDNQHVAQGELLAVIDPTPFLLQVKNAAAELDQAKARLELQQSSLVSAKAMLDETASSLHLASVTVQRYRDLMQRKAIARQDYDEKVDAYNEAADRHKQAQATVDEAAKGVKAKQMDIAALQAGLELAQYNADHTRLYAPVAGYVTALDIKPGDYAKVGQAIMAVVSDADWRIMANYREQFVRHIREGQNVVVHLDSHPWRLFEGVVQGVARGVSRDPAPEKLLPYVEPKTNWIRLSRRFPVRIHFKERPPDLLLSGSDARTVVVY